MKRFQALEGLRGVLAWAVVFSHLANFSDIYKRGFGALVNILGTPSVLIFVIISGFVITHAILERPEPYRSYLTRRFMRIFPLFAITSVLGYFACDVQVFTLASVAYSGNPDFDFRSVVNGIASSNHQNFWPHALAHLTMLHGAISDDVLPFSEYAFNMPAWSVSLEWQFYVIAPFVLAIVMRRKNLFLFAFILVVVEAALLRAHLFGHFSQPSILPAAATYFAIGIACRLTYPVLAGSTRYPIGISALIIIMLLPISSVLTAPVLVWMLVYLGLIVGREGDSDTLYAQIHRRVWENPLILYFGSRSYSIYLTHMLTITLCHFLWMKLQPMAGPMETFVALSIMTVPVTMAVAEVLYRSVERPGIALGSRIAQWLNRPSVPLVGVSQGVPIR